MPQQIILIEYLFKYDFSSTVYKYFCNIKVKLFTFSDSLLTLRGLAWSTYAINKTQKSPWGLHNIIIIRVCFVFRLFAVAAFFAIVYEVDTFPCLNAI